jgi:hypothetical protein
MVIDTSKIIQSRYSKLVTIPSDIFKESSFKVGEIVQFEKVAKNKILIKKYNPDKINSKMKEIN